jgi:hypothetical protein
MKPWRKALLRMFWVREIPSTLDPMDTTSFYSDHVLFNSSEIEHLLNQELVHLPGLSLQFELKKPGLRFDSDWELYLAYIESVVHVSSNTGHTESFISPKKMHARLQQWFQRKREAIINEPGSSRAYRDAPEHVVLPVFVFDYAVSSPITFEGRLTHAIFDDMIIVLQFHSPNRPISLALPYKCEQLMPSFSAANITRTLFGAILSHLWNLVPLHEFWDAAHDKPGVDFLWAPNPSPLAVMSNAVELSFFHAEIAQRNLLLSRLTYIQNTLAAHLQPLSSSGFHLHNLLPADAFHHFLHRWNLIELKLLEFSAHLSVRKYNNALRFLSSLSYDIEAIVPLLQEARSRILHDFVCPDSAPAQASLINETSLVIDVIFGPFLTIGLIVFLLYTQLSRKQKNH